MATESQVERELRPPQVSGPFVPGKLRLDAIDIMRGLVMVVMALDHVRDYMSFAQPTPEHWTTTSLALWLTRWITHFCAPAFVFLAGTGAYLSYARHGDVARTARFLWTRGLWLVFAEYTIIGFGWSFLFPFGFAQVIWVIGWSMVINSFLIRLPLRWVAAFGAVLVLGHNLLDYIQPPGGFANFGKVPWYWVLFHTQGFIPVKPPGFLHVPPNFPFGIFVVYPLIPWVGVMSLGFVFGVVLRRAAAERQRWMLRAGAALTAAFVVLRAFNLYGNPKTLAAAGPDIDATFHLQPTLAKTFILFTDVEKYPPSLQFLLMTLGPTLMLIALFDRMKIDRAGIGNAVARFFVVFGRVPFFYYVLHLYVVHLLAYFAALATGQPAQWLLRGAMFGNPLPPGYGHHLPFLYATWALAIAILYFPCLWFMHLKQRRRDWWLSYL
jgi:uncharacterized membrane protein